MLSNKPETKIHRAEMTCPFRFTFYRDMCAVLCLIQKLYMISIQLFETILSFLFLFHASFSPTTIPLFVYSFFFLYLSAWASNDFTQKGIRELCQVRTLFMLALQGSLKGKFQPLRNKRRIRCQLILWPIFKFLAPGLKGIKDRSKVLNKSFSVPHRSFDPSQN